MSESNTCHQLDQENVVIARRYDMIPREPAASDHDYVDVPNMPVLSTYKEAVVEYIAGYVVKTTEKGIACTECKLALRAQDERSVESSVPSLVRCKVRGGHSSQGNASRGECSDAIHHR